MFPDLTKKSGATQTPQQKTRENVHSGLMHFSGEKPAQRVEQSFFTRKQETAQIATANIVRTIPPTQEFMPLGYNRENMLDRIARANFWNFNVALNPAHVAEYNKNGHINFEQFARSATDVYGINSNQFIWDPIPELENFPVSGHPEKVSQQYVLYNVEPGYVRSTKKALHISQQSIPTAYNAVAPTHKSQTVVYQTPVTQLQEAMSGMSIFKRIKTFLVGE